MIIFNLKFFNVILSFKPLEMLRLLKMIIQVDLGNLLALKLIQLH